ncbi:hypothetical protein E3N88_38674 [Mikania micrantha]|uniref:Uncharacterized protein n=1 Tax=Mikania micrantha TaxID=192012 RepID=A0A5N6LUQ2_9ASTR|nr:hypothetical protein E3N88_38674 [Mikania micrantha]
MAPKRGRPAKRATQNITNPEQNQIPPLTVESNPDPRVNPEVNVVPPGNLETNTAPPVNPGASTVPPAGTSGSETNEAMIARCNNSAETGAGTVIATVAQTQTHKHLAETKYRTMVLESDNYLATLNHHGLFVRIY